ncbi:hypothetical protein MKW94_023321 [Papaver nudicaule]|uniref:Helicase-like transcription factor CHR28 n=1 Tax=Papaver nudicaule TaxID=74823 RepID=A0AA41RW12_PAPNU|nr:hypothetical protein [Papaver nudicaule]
MAAAKVVHYISSDSETETGADVSPPRTPLKSWHTPIPFKRTTSRAFVPVNMLSMLSNVGRLSRQNSFCHPSPVGDQCASVGENVSDHNANVKDALGDTIVYEHKGDGVQQPTLVTGEPHVDSCDLSLKCSVTKDFARTPTASVDHSAYYPGFKEKQIKSDVDVGNNKNGNRIVYPSWTNNFDSTPTASVNHSAYDPGFKEKQIKSDVDVAYNKNGNRTVYPSWMIMDAASAPTASVNHSAYYPGIEEKQIKPDVDVVYNKNGNGIVYPWMNKDVASAPTASVSHAAHLPGVEERQTENEEKVVLQAALKDLSQPKVEVNLPDGLLTVPLLKHQKIALAWMVQREKTRVPCSGGILADDQGLGKTVSMIALIQYQRYLQSQSTTGNQIGKRSVHSHLNGDHEMGETLQIGLNNNQHMYPGANGNDHVYKERPKAGTLIVCPASIICQWAQELNDKVADGVKLSVLVYHGSTRTKDPVKLAKYDVVLTTYTVVANAFPKEGDAKKRKSGTLTNASFSTGCISDPLAKVYWLRVILDEAQCIKNYRTRSADGCCGLRAKSRWCLSGTPLQNKIDDLYSYFKFLQYHPYTVHRKFSSSLKSRSSTSGYRKLQVVLDTILLRRTKETLIDGKPIITLPPKSISMMKIELSTKERSFYSQLEETASIKFREYDRAGTVNQNYASILVLLLYLRMACDHPLLTKKQPHKPDKTSLESARKLPKDMLCKLYNLLENSSAVCGECKDAPEDAVVTTCGHVFCYQCVAEHLVGAGNLCPEFDCKIHLTSNLVYSKATLSRFLPCEPINATSPSEVTEESAVLQRSYRSTKIKAALEILKSNCKLNNRRAIVSSEGLNGSSLSSGDFSIENCSDSLVDAPVKTIVFSQWTRMLDLMEISLDESGIRFNRFDGRMSMAERDKAVKDFTTDPEVNVILMSLKAGNLGLNLVAACHVILLDLWWNPTTEDQAIDRAHRLGQTRPVTVTRLAVSDTVEDRILKLQKKKRELVASVFGDHKFGGSSARLSVDDLRFLFGF